MPRGIYIRTKEQKEKLRIHFMLINKSKDQIGEKNSMWKGDEVSYHTLHRWVTRHKGRPNLCEHCKTTISKRYEWASISHKPKRDLSDYIRLCSSCHHKFDNQGQMMKETRIKRGSFIFYGNQFKKGGQIATS